MPEGRRFTAGETAREMGRRGAKKTNAKKRARKSLREEFDLLLSGDITDKNGKTMNAQTAMSTAMLKEALKGNVRAYLAIRETLGEDARINAEADALASAREILGGIRSAVK